MFAVAYSPLLVGCTASGKFPFHTHFTCWGVQAVALGAAVQAGVYEGSVSGVMVMDIWQASLMRALAKQKLKDDEELAEQLQVEGDGSLADEDDGDWEDDQDD